MSTDRWSDKTQDLVADLLYRRDGDGHVDARRVLAALAHAALLLSPGDTTTEEVMHDWRSGVLIRSVRTVRTWPDGSRWHGPWREVQP